MRRMIGMTVTVGSVGMLLVGGTAVAFAKDSDRVRSDSGFSLEIDPELDAQFGPRPVNATQAAAIITRAFPGARVTEAELDERGGGPIWEIKFLFAGREQEVDVDALTGAVLGRDVGDDD
jgi:uncharacterized membrane protein YkoI